MRRIGRKDEKIRSRGNPSYHLVRIFIRIYKVDSFSGKYRQKNRFMAMGGRDEWTFLCHLSVIVGTFQTPGCKSSYFFLFVFHFFFLYPSTAVNEITTKRSQLADENTKTWSATYFHVFFIIYFLNYKNIQKKNLFFVWLFLDALSSFGKNIHRCRLNYDNRLLHWNLHSLTWVFNRWIKIRETRLHCVSTLNHIKLVRQQVIPVSWNSVVKITEVTQRRLGLRMRTTT